ncbi:hypothetical protein HDU76_001010, partial [Blyttiomyces sp. JEL0837]
MSSRSKRKPAKAGGSVRSPGQHQKYEGFKESLRKASQPAPVVEVKVRPTPLNPVRMSPTQSPSQSPPPFGEAEPQEIEAVSRAPAIVPPIPRDPERTSLVPLPPPLGEAEQQESPVGDVEQQERPAGEVEQQETPVCEVKQQEAPVGLEQPQTPVGEVDQQETPVGEAEQQQIEAVSPAAAIANSTTTDHVKQEPPQNEQTRDHPTVKLPISIADQDRREQDLPPTDQATDSAIGDNRTSSCSSTDIQTTTPDNEQSGDNTSQELAK